MKWRALSSLAENVSVKKERATMSNFIFISPNFPTNYWQFCRELKNDGMNVRI